MRRTRLAPLLGSVIFAAAFIVVRVFWRLVTDGISLAAAAAAASSALPFAALILGFGLVATISPPRRWLGRLPQAGIAWPLRAAMGIGFVVLSDVTTEALLTRATLRLRGIRRGWFAVVPLLEHTIERALAIAAWLALRGSGPTPAGSAEVHLTEVSLRFGTRTVLDRVTTTFGPGITVLTGPTGSGKTSLLELITGLAEEFSGAQRTGAVTVCGIDRSAPIAATAALLGYVPQRPRLALVETEIESNSSSDMLGRTSSRWVDELSAGEVSRLALDAALAKRPRVLLLDEPLADLDHAGRGDLLARLTELADSGVTVVIAEHDSHGLESLNPRWLQLEHGTLREGRWHVDPPAARPVESAGGSESEVRIQLSQLQYRGAPQRMDLQVSLAGGSRIALVGPNGSGKSSLLRALAHPAPGSLLVRGRDAAGRRPHPWAVALVPDEIPRMWVCETLAEELTFADRVAHGTAGTTERTLRGLLRSTPIDDLLSSHPRDLSAGAQRALAIAAQLTFQPGLLLVDEPTRGLDSLARADMMDMLGCVAETGAVVIFATHDERFAGAVASTVWSMSDGIVTPATLEAKP